ncbi:hypothetical protein VNI00_003823 [Paramarasmius palmivorus]|uniref:P-loop containing nucleoside triphosphate hydrolase protein n=1 Tax=Paramarasmius palmivorus TaxID=297713 RepID=A0AAW0DLC3_9AGAR
MVSNSELRAHAIYYLNGVEEAAGSSQMSAQRIYIISHPRSRCNLLFRLLSSHPSVAATPPFQFLLACSSGPEYQGPERSPQVNDGNTSEQTYQEAFDLLRGSVEDIEVAGKIPLAMEHPQYIVPHDNVDTGAKFPSPRNRTGPVEPPVITFNGTTDTKTNPTCLPDAFLSNFTPIITIRHPARVLPSYIRATFKSKMASEFTSLDEEGKALFLHKFEKAARFRWDRIIFDSLAGKGKVRIVVDGDKLARDPKGQMKVLCDALGIDSRDGNIKFTWGNEDGRKGGDHGWMSEDLKEAFFGSLRKSTGVVEDKRLDDPVDVAKERFQWAEEWGEELASYMEDMVQGAVEDYEYLRQFAI